MTLDKNKNRQKAQNTLKIAIILILLITFIRGVIYATVFPLWQAPDEQVQFQYIDFYARKHLPFENKASYKINDGYILKDVDKEILDSWYQLKSWEYISWEKRRNWLKSDKRLKEKLDGWYGVIYKNPPGYPIAVLPLYTPFYFTDVQVRAYVMRLFSVILGVLVVYLGYRTAKELFPDDIFIILGTPLFITFIPMFTHMTGAVNPDNLANFSAALFIFYSVKILKKFTWPNFIVLLLSVFIGIFTKRTVFFTFIMLLIIPIFIFLLSENDRFKASNKRNRLIFIYSVLTLLGGIYLVPAVGNKLGLYAFDLASIISIKNATIEYFKTKPMSEFIYAIKLFSESFWAVFAWGIRISNLSYFILWNFNFVPIVCLLFALGKEWLLNKRSLFSRYQGMAVLYLAIFFIISLTIVVGRSLMINKEQIPGRYLFPVIVPIAIYVTVGLSQLFKNKQQFKLLLMLVVLFLFDASSLLIYVIPFYYKTPQSYNLSFLPALADLFYKPFILNSIYFYIFIFTGYLFLIGLFVYCLLFVTNTTDLSMWTGPPLTASSGAGRRVKRKRRRRRPKVYYGLQSVAVISAPKCP